MFPTLVLRVHMCKTSTNRDKKSIGPPSYGESYRGRSAGPPLSSTPIDIIWIGVARWTFVLGCVWLGHRFITNHICAQTVTRSYPVPPKTASFTLIIKDGNTS